jgi:PBP1b-binding outer membrane lipoprotein LpoB/TolB-like protein
MLNEKIKMIINPYIFLLFGALIASGCATPKVSSTNEMNLDDEDSTLAGGIGSRDIRTIATSMAPEILGLPEISQADGVARIAISPIRNNSRFIIDKDIFMRRLRLELNKYGSGQVRFFSQGRNQAVRQEVLEGRDEIRLQEMLDQIGDEIARSSWVTSADVPPRIAVLPVLNSNFVNMNADSVVAMLRARVVSKTEGKVAFLLPGEMRGADYILTGQFIAESLQTEGIVNLVNYIEVVDERLREGKSLNVYDDIGDGNVSNENGNQVVISSGVRQQPSMLELIARNQQLRISPNINKYLNIMVADAESKTTVYENMFAVEKKITQGLGRANYILSGEISALSKGMQGRQTDYLLYTFQLVDPDSNEILWEDGFEFKRSTSSGIVYQ